MTHINAALEVISVATGGGKWGQLPPQPAPDPVLRFAQIR